MRIWRDQKDLERKLVHRLRKQWLEDLAREGHNASVTAEIVGMDRAFFRHETRRAGVRFEKKKRGKEFQDQKVVDCFESGMSIAATALEIGVSKYTVQAARKRLGLSGYPPRLSSTPSRVSEVAKCGHEPKTLAERMMADAKKVRQRQREAWS